MHTTISTRWQTVVPKDVREALGIEPGMKLAWRVGEGTATVVPIPEDPVRASVGLLKDTPLTVEDLLEERRRDLELEEKKFRRYLEGPEAPASDSEDGP